MLETIVSDANDMIAGLRTPIPIQRWVTPGYITEKIPHLDDLESQQVLLRGMVAVFRAAMLTYRHHKFVAGWQQGYADSRLQWVIDGGLLKVPSPAVGDGDIGERSGGDVNLGERSGGDGDGSSDSTFVSRRVQIQTDYQMKQNIYQAWNLPQDKFIGSEQCSNLGFMVDLLEHKSTEKEVVDVDHEDGQAAVNTAFSCKVKRHFHHYHSMTMKHGSITYVACLFQMLDTLPKGVREVTIVSDNGSGFHTNLVISVARWIPAIYGYDHFELVFMEAGEGKSGLDRKFGDMRLACIDFVRGGKVIDGFDSYLQVLSTVPDSTIYKLELESLPDTVFSMVFAGVSQYKVFKFDKNGGVNAQKIAHGLTITKLEAAKLDRFGKTCVLDKADDVYQYLTSDCERARTVAAEALEIYHSPVNRESEKYMALLVERFDGELGNLAEEGSSEEECLQYLLKHFNAPELRSLCIAKRLKKGGNKTDMCKVLMRGKQDGDGDECVDAGDGRTRKVSSCVVCGHPMHSGEHESCRARAKFLACNPAALELLFRGKAKVDVASSRIDSGVAVTDEERHKKNSKRKRDAEERDLRANKRQRLNDKDWTEGVQAERDTNRGGARKTRLRASTGDRRASNGRRRRAGPPARSKL
eukprot:TRINITY_DN26097_c0_g1_i1.p1 TRINITY_DN26097_c0_g1~~TRINITY_DN26097_c0_g1_i1.p1  ORF type:complete len:740 (-),score=76.41 TRINITY_DN26097_c0_g1_i1:127-2046(-)